MASKADLARARQRSAADRATSTTGKLVSLGGGWAAGRYARNTEIMGYPAPLVAGGLGILLAVRGRRSKSMKLLADLFIGAGAYGAGKLGEDQAEASGNAGVLFGEGA